eukprot:TRINITY_DN15957_c0_g6_i1.p1 TRINITY_DN15957_c0_g6~~TRINITY_DN15957_c0_g6_i1.p1  ORF type:complete len:785 (-),score=167.53 TRINITY_DN15957_c0_g6_i1:97-2451(-)
MKRPLIPSMPLFVPASQPLELYFFQRVFHRLYQRKAGGGVGGQTAASSELADCFQDQEDDIEDKEVLLVEFNRAMARLFQVIEDKRAFNAAAYDSNMNGKVGWLEFCSLWKERQIAVHLTMPERIFLVFEDAERCLLGRLMSLLVFLTILISTGSFIVSTLPVLQSRCPILGEDGYDENCRPVPKPIFDLIDLGCISFFTVEYAVRLVLSAFMRTELVNRDLLLEWMVSDETTTPPRFYVRVAEFAMNWHNLVDFAAILPWYLQKAVGVDPNMGGGNTYISMIRLMRVVRAFRLARRFEAVVIIMRSQRKSLRALYVLVLNLLLGMVIFGALMYFAEQGSWNPSTHAWEREVSHGAKERNPFESIPACFWWAIVTATTVGYGDDHTPTTPPGKLVAGTAMVWSVCVLALPIGVIGGNFIQVWDEYDREKRREFRNRHKEERMLKKSLAWGDPLHYSRRLLIEIWHDVGLPDYTAAVNERGSTMQSEFMGEVDYLLDLPPQGGSRRCERIPVTANFGKARRQVRGQLTFEYTWTPRKPNPESGGSLLCGCLEVKLIRADNLVSIDWKGPDGAEPFCVVVAHPHSPGKDGIIGEVRKATCKAKNSVFPRWDHKVRFDVNWTQSAEFTRLAEDQYRKRWCSPMVFPLSSKDPQAEERPHVAVTDGSENERLENQRRSSLKSRQKPEEPQVTILRESVPKLQADVAQLQKAVPELQREVAGVRSDLALILGVLQQRAKEQAAAATAAGGAHAGNSVAGLGSPRETRVVALPSGPRVVALPAGPPPMCR